MSKESQAKSFKLNEKDKYVLTHPAVVRRYERAVFFALSLIPVLNLFMLWCRRTPAFHHMFSLQDDELYYWTYRLLVIVSVLCTAFSLYAGYYWISTAVSWIPSLGFTLPQFAKLGSIVINPFSIALALSMIFTTILAIVSINPTKHIKRYKKAFIEAVKRLKEAFNIANYDEDDILVLKELGLYVEADGDCSKELCMLRYSRTKIKLILTSTDLNEEVMKKIGDILSYKLYKQWWTTQTQLIKELIGYPKKIINRNDTICGILTLVDKVNSLEYNRKYINNLFGDSKELFKSYSYSSILTLQDKNGKSLSLKDVTAYTQLKDCFNRAHELYKKALMGTHKEYFNYLKLNCWISVVLKCHFENNGKLHADLIISLLTHWKEKSLQNYELENFEKVLNQATIMAKTDTEENRKFSNRLLKILKVNNQQAAYQFNGGAAKQGVVNLLYKDVSKKLQAYNIEKGRTITLKRFSLDKGFSANIRKNNNSGNNHEIKIDNDNNAKNTEQSRTRLI